MAEVESLVRNRHVIWPTIKQDDRIAVKVPRLTENSDSVRTSCTAGGGGERWDLLAVLIIGPKGAPGRLQP